MRDYDNSQFYQIMELVKDKENSVINVNIPEADILSLQYYMTRSFYYAVIIDDYPFEISDKNSLLEALYYQARLITVHDLNWDAIQEGLGDALNNFLEFEGICLLFKCKGMKSKAADELRMLIEIVEDINKQPTQKQLKIILYQQ